MVKLALLVVLLAGFLAESAVAISAVGYLGFYQAMAANAATNLAMLDLVISLGLILTWMWGDSRERGLPFAGYAIVTALLGVAGPLGYLIHREARSLRTTRRQTVIA
jgi:hypothetical protein